MTKNLFAAHAPVILMAAVAIFAAPLQAAPKPSMKSLAAAIQESPAGDKTSSLTVLHTKSFAISSLALSQEPRAKKPQNLSMLNSDSLTSPQGLRPTMSRGLRSLASHLSKSEAIDLHSKGEGKKSSLITTTSSFSPLATEVMMAAPSTKTQARL